MADAIRPGVRLPHREKWGRYNLFMAKQQFNRRLSDEAITAISWWAKQDSTPARKVTDTEIVERAIALYDQMRANGGGVPEAVPVIPEAQRVESRPSTGRITNISANAGFDPATIPGVSRGVSTNFTCRCIHSGCKGSKFQGASKYANLCPACGESGHSGDPRSCQECFNDMGPA